MVHGVRKRRSEVENARNTSSNIARNILEKENHSHRKGVQNEMLDNE